MNLTATAGAIRQHLKRIEDDDELNPLPVEGGGRRFWHTDAHRSGSYVRVQYISYEGSMTINRETAERYLKWLEAGNVGSHFTMQRDLARSPRVHG